MKKFLSLALALVMCLSLVTISAGAKDFTDDSSINYDEAVKVMSTVSVIDGYEDGTFNPSATLTRGAAAKIICNMVLGPTTAGALTADAAPFKDVPASHVFAGQIAYCSQQGIINGYDDGSFRPAGTVTGYQFLKMLLGALGYDGSLEGYTGSNWSIQVAKQALAIGLTDGNDSFVGTTAMTREEACLYALNTMKADMVDYSDKGSSIIVGGVEIVNPASKAEVLPQAPYKDSMNDGQTTHTLQFAEKYFTNLTRTDSKDDLGRAADQWKYKGAKVGTYANGSAVASYTAKTKESVVKDDMSSYDYSKTAVSVYYNGKETTAVMTNAAVANLTGNGTLVEVYVTDNEVSRVVVAQAYLGQVTKVDDKDESISVKLDTAVGSKTITDSTGYGAYEKDDMVMVVPAYSKAINAPASIVTGSSSDILTITEATKATGKISAVKNGKYLTLDGTTYDYASQQTGSFSASVSNVADVDVYIDAYGYVVGCEAAAAAGNYLYLAKSWTGTDDYGTPCVKAQVVLSDGTISTIVVDKVDGDTAVDQTDSPLTGEKKADPDMYRYSVSGSKYSLTSNDAYMNDGGSQTIESSTAKIGSAYFADNTNFVVVSGSAGSDLKATVYTGKQAMSGAATCYYTTTKASGTTIATIFVVGSDAVTSSSDLVYVKSASSVGTIQAGGTNYSAYEVYVNGESKTIPSKTAPAANKFYTYGVDSDGVYTLTEKTGGVIVNDTIDGLYNTQYITINSTDLSAGNYSVSDATVVDTRTEDDCNDLSALQELFDSGKTVSVALIFSSSDKTVSMIYVLDAVNPYTVATPDFTAAETGYTVTADKTSAVKDEIVTVTVSATDAAATKDITVAVTGTGATVDPSTAVTHTSGTAGSYEFEVTVGTGNVTAITVTLA